MVFLALWDKMVSWWTVDDKEERKRSLVILMRNMLLVDSKVYMNVPLTLIVFSFRISTG